MFTQDGRLVGLFGLAICAMFCGTVQGGPQIKFDAAECDFGTVFKGDDSTHVFPFRNDGDSDLVIEKVSTTCRCTIGYASGMRVPPKGSDKISITFHTSGYEGVIERTIYVYTNDADNPTVSLKLKAIVRDPGASFEPRAVQCGDMKKGSCRSFQLRMTWGKEGAKIARIESSSPGVGAGFAGASGDGLDKNWRITVSVDANRMGLGRFIEFITIYTASERYPMYEIPVRGRIVE